MTTLATSTDGLPLGLTAEQHSGLGGLLAVRGDVRRPEPQQPQKPRYPGACRVILLDENIVYSPRETRDVVLFFCNPDGCQFVIEFSGYALNGDLVLTLAETQIRISCQATTEELRAALLAAEVSFRDCRATVFPGLWEFDFNGGQWRDDPPALDCVPWEPPADDEETPVFGGELSIIREAWLSDTLDGVNLVTLPVRDWVPHKPGAVKAGSVGVGLVSYSGGWLVLAWACRDYSFETPATLGE